MSTAGKDLRYAFRAMRTNPGFTAIAVTSLALGIGVNTAIFSLVDQLLLWSVPARDPGRLVYVEGGRSSTFPFYREYRDRNQVFSGMFASSNVAAAGMRPEGAPAVEVGHICFVSGTYFETLGAGAAAGRVIHESDDRVTGGSPVVVLSYDYWQRRFGGDLRVIGHKLAVNGFPLEIAGIAEKGFGGIFNTRPAEVFIPLTMYPAITPAATPVWNTPGMHWLVTMARLKPGMSIEHAQAGMRVLWPQVVDAVNDATVKNGGQRRKYAREEQITLAPARHGASTRKEGIDPLAALMIATGLVLLIACANVANLLLARGAGRRREMAVRAAVGATRARLIRQLLTESLVLGSAGGAGGLAFAYWCVMALARANLVDPSLRFRLDFRVAAFSLAVTVLTALLFGLVPAFRGSRMALAFAIKHESGPHMRLGKTVIVGQVALSLALLVGAGLFIRTLRNLQGVDLGFRREGILIADVDPSKLGYRDHRLRTFYDQLLERTRRIPGVRSTALSLMTPMGEYAMTRSFSAEGYQPKPGEDLMAFSNPVTSAYFTTLGIPMLLGRDFRAEDEPAVTPKGGLMAALGRASGGSNEAAANASRVCIINESLARHLFGNQNPVGRHLSYDDRYAAEGALEIVGVVKDVHHWDVRHSDQEGIIYVPSWSNGAEPRWLGVRVAGDASPVIASIRRELREMDPNVPLLRTRMLEDYVNASFRQERLIAYLCGSFGALALALAAIGLYGVMAYAVSQRTREVGVRMALGAQPREVMRMIVRESLVPVLFGTGIGLAGALALTRLVSGMLYGVAPGDPLSMALAAGAMLAAALLAAAIPAHRASRVDPMTALRWE